ncbi:TPA: hypothetical protein ACH3X1_015901 [Trebouxia sp. C0004]
MATHAKKTRLPMQWVQKDCITLVELPEQLTHLLGVVIHLTLLVRGLNCGALAHVSYDVHKLSRTGFTCGDTCHLFPCLFSLTAGHNSSLTGMLQGRTSQQEVLHSQNNKMC